MRADGDFAHHVGSDDGRDDVARSPSVHGQDVTSAESSEADSQTAEDKDPTDANLLPPRHVQTPDHRHGKDEHGDVEKRVDGCQRDQRRLHVDAMSGRDAVPEVMDRRARKDGREEASYCPADDECTEDIEADAKVRALCGEYASI